jgi:hypothetical protein
MTLPDCFDFVDQACVVSVLALRHHDPFGMLSIFARLVDLRLCWDIHNILIIGGIVIFCLFKLRGTDLIG